MHNSITSCLCILLSVFDVSFHSPLSQNEGQKRQLPKKFLSPPYRTKQGGKTKHLFENFSNYFLENKKSRAQKATTPPADDLPAYVVSFCARLFGGVSYTACAVSPLLGDSKIPHTKVLGFIQLCLYYSERMFVCQWLVKSFLFSLIIAAKYLTHLTVAISCNPR